MNLGSGLTVSVKTFESGARLPRHAHEGAYCCLLLGGAAIETCNGDIAELESATFSVRHPDSTHSVQFSPETASAVIIELDVGRFDLLTSSGLMPDPGVWAAPAQARTAAVRIVREIGTSDAGSNLIVEGLALELLGAAVRDSLHRDGPRPPMWVREAYDRLMEDDDLGALSIADLAEWAGVEPGHFVSVFRSWYHASPADLLRRIRFERATVLLGDSDLSLAQIAEQTGYYDQSHFTNDFRSRSGVTPGKYRRSLRSQASSAT